MRRTDFSCGEPELDLWLREHAGQQERRDASRTWLAVDEAEVAIAGYFTTVTYEVTPEDLGGTLGAPRRYPVPAVLIARLAVDSRYQGQGVGRLLLFDALRRLEVASRDIGFELIVVDALHESAALFYLKYGFRRFSGRPLTLFMTCKAVRATFAGEDG